MSRSLHLGHRAPVLWLLLPFATGLTLAHASPRPLPEWAPVLGGFLSLALALLADRCGRPYLWTSTWSLGLIFLGLGYYEVRRERLPAWDPLPVREVVLTVKITRELAPSADGVYRRQLGRVVAAPTHLKDLVGQPLHLNLRRPAVDDRWERGALIEVRGRLEPLARQPSEPGFEEYLIDSGHNFRLGRGRFVRLVREPGPYARLRATIKARAGNSLVRGLDHHPTLGAALRAMLLGERGEIGAEQKLLFVRSGTMHLFAISGLHIGVIAGVLYGGLRLIRLQRVGALLVGVGLLGFYVDLIGGTPSARRAWIMVTCVQVGYVWRSPSNPVSGLAWSALIVLLLNLLELFSAGFQMSYGIVTALLLYGLPLGERWQARWRPWRDLPVVSLQPWQTWWARRWEEITTVTALAVAATQVGLVSGVAIFGWFTPVTLIANLLLIPLTSLAIMGGVVALLAGLLGVTMISLVFNHAAALLVATMEAILHALLVVPGAAVPGAFQPDIIGPTLGFVLLGLMILGYERGWRGWGGSFWLPPGVLALALVTCLRIG